MKRNFTKLGNVFNAETLNFSLKRIKLFYFMFSIIIFCSSCNGQNEKNKKAETNTIVQNEKSTKPKIDIKVNKRYDKNGNIIAYDSTYSSFYSKRKGDKVLIDSLFQKFKPEFSKTFPLVEDNNINNLFFNDSLLYSDFFHDDFFSKRFELNTDYMQNMMKEMDSVKNNFFRIQSTQINK